MILVKGGYVKPISGPDIPCGDILVEDGKIAKVGAKLRAPAKCKVLDASGCIVAPGFVEAHCHVGLHGEAVRWEGSDINEYSNPVTPQLRAIDGILDAAGIEVCIVTDAPVIPLEYLPLCAGLAVKSGMKEEAAWRAITLNPAHVAGIDSRVGSLEPGKDADIVVFEGNPLREIAAHPRFVMVDGKVVAGGSR